MKNILAVIVLALVAGCSQPEEGHKKASIVPTEEERTEYMATRTHVFEKTVNGHVYVVARPEGTQAGISMMHSPSCPCQNKED